MAAMAKKVLLLRSAEGKVLMAPTWDGRLFPQLLPPLETGLPTRALEKVIEYWTIHNRAAARGHAGGDLLAKWDLEFVRRLGEEEGLLDETHAAAVFLQRHTLADQIVLFLHSRAQAERPHLCSADLPDDVPAPAAPPGPAPATRRLRRKVSACRGPRPAFKRLVTRVNPLRRKDTAGTLSPATSEVH